MTEQLLIDLGLTKSQAQTYSILVENGRLTPPEAAKLSGESRTAAYMALTKLEEIGLAVVDKSNKKLTYLPASPSVLDKYIESKRREFTTLEERYQSSLANLLKQYYATTRQTSVRYYRGKEGLKAIYDDHIATGKDLYLLRTYADEDFFEEWLYEYMDARAQRGINTFALLPFDLNSYAWAKKNDTRLLRKSSWYPRNSYTAPVEIAAFGNKISIISFDGEASGTVLEDSHIADAMKQLIDLAGVGAKTLLQNKK